MMLVLMRIGHSRFAEVPTALEFKQLLELARICNRYDTNQLIYPYIHSWISPHQPKILQQGYEQWLYIAYQFGLEDDYSKLSKYLAIECRINPEKQLLVPGAGQVMTGCFPDECLCKYSLHDVHDDKRTFSNILPAAIRHSRVKTLVSILNTVYSLVTKMTQGNTCQAQNPTPTLPGIDERTLCTHYNHGSLQRYLKMQGYWPPIFNVGSIEGSVVEMTDGLFAIPKINMPSLRCDSVTINDGTTQSTTPDKQHAACDAGMILADKIQEVLDRLKPVVEMRTLEAIRTNARKSGLTRLGER
jgi:hypothetical protein